MGTYLLNNPRRTNPHHHNVIMDRLVVWLYDIVYSVEEIGSIVDLQFK